MKQKAGELYFFIGTEAELIKVFTVILEAKKRRIPYKIIASGQNPIKDSELLKICNDGKIDILLSDKEIKKSVVGLFLWFIQTYLNASKILKNKLVTGSIMIVHGDTISTVMGARIGKKFGLKVAHIEAGLRSFNIFSPFPEEIDRMITSMNTNFHFVPNSWALKNIEKLKGEKINTGANTLIDSLKYSENMKTESSLLNNLPSEYFVFVLHRQENLLNEKFIKEIIDVIISTSKTQNCVFVLHEPTKVVLEKNGLLQKIEKEKNIILTDRVKYFDFMKLLRGSQFVITDGGSNQEELFYMGKPCLLLRKKTERIEGLNENVVISHNEFDVILDFIKNHKAYSRERTEVDERPSKIIIDVLEKEI